MGSSIPSPTSPPDPHMPESSMPDMSTVTTTTTSQQPPKDGRLDQPTDAVPLSEIDRVKAKATTTTSTSDQTEESRGPSIPGPATATPDSEPPTQSTPAAGNPSQTPETNTSSLPTKGKAKEDGATAPTSPIAKQALADDDSLSIEPSSGAIATATATDSSASRVCAITLLLPTGARHPYRIDEKYLSKRNVEIPDVTESGQRDPFSISIYKLKELILREWRDEWDGKPASPSSIRLIHFGKLLDDKEQLKKYQFSADSPNVVHMSVKPAEMVEEDEAGKTKGTSQGGRSREGGGGCCVIL
ncbi:ubiquitin-related domain-containing protein [Cercophora scortea]|uniref:Ubiquitin-related domain-containing protein n=1 Tax=Cercophora scortea TaxID=314031 RepID=A0AAE0IGP9_9PEZI|nr:ubiquitin-related domain-containing protein [Cercophora scortea]